MKSYPSEAIGQTAFFSSLNIKPNYSHHTDGIVGGVLFEHKLNIKDLDTVLFQAIKYAALIREAGERLPAYLLLNDLNSEKAYVFQTADFLTEIEQPHFNAPSKGNATFHTAIKPVVFDWENDPSGTEWARLTGFIQQAKDQFTLYHVDTSNIIGLAEAFYNAPPYKALDAKAKEKANLKKLFLDQTTGEIRRPNLLKDRILPYTELDNDAFGSVMDCLNPEILQREIGAYYTPPAYVKEMQRMLIQAVSEVPEGWDYVIIDRCAGVGNLERGLSDDILSHCVLSTLEPLEYHHLKQEFGAKAAVVVPHTDALAWDIIPAEHQNGAVLNDAVRERVLDPKCVVILVENPPFSAASVGAVQTTGSKSNLWKKSLIHEEMVKAGLAEATSDLAHLFIWSGFRYYLTKPEDSYILFAPTAYWRNRRLVAHQSRGGFLCNRKEFHAKQNSAMACVWWKNQPDPSRKLSLSIMEIQRPAKGHPDFSNENAWTASSKGSATLRKADRLLSEGYDRRKFPNDTMDGVLCELNGNPFRENGRQKSVRPIYNSNMIGYILAHSFTVDRKMVGLLRCGRYDGHGFFLRSDNFLEKLPLFVAAAYPYSDQWWTTDVFSKSYDGSEAHLKDPDFLTRCLFYTAMTYKNKCRSFHGPDGRDYRNELCFAPGTLAQQAWDAAIKAGRSAGPDETALLDLWATVQTEAQKTSEWTGLIRDWHKVPTKKPLKHGLTPPPVGLWQIMEEVNTDKQTGAFTKDGKPITTKSHPTLHTAINAMNDALKAYYQKHLVADLFRYELLK